MSRDRQPGAWLRRAHAFVVWLYPPRFRAEYGHAMRQILRDLSRDGAVPRCSLWRTVLADVPDSVVPEHVASLLGGETVDPIGLIRNPAVRVGTVFGLAMGAALAVVTVVNQAFVLDDRGYAVLNNAFMAVHLLCAVAAFAAARAAGSLKAGILAGVTTAVVGAAIGLAAMWIATPIFWDNNFHNPGMLADFRHSGMSSMDAFILDDALGATFFGALASLAIGVVLGAIGGTVGRLVADRPGRAGPIPPG